MPEVFFLREYFYREYKIVWVFISSYFLAKLINTLQKISDIYNFLNMNHREILTIK